MKSNDRLYKTSLILTGVLIAVGFAFLSHVRLDGPVFLEHNINLHVTEERGGFDFPVSLNYITNADDNRIVTWVEFEEYPGLQVNASENEFAVLSGGREVQSFDDQWGRDFGQYNVREVFLQMNQLPELEEGEELLLTEATVTFSDATTQTVDIGEMIISSQDTSDAPLSFSFSSSTSNGQMAVTYNAEEELSVLGMDAPYFEQFSDAVRLEVNGMDSQEIIGQMVQEGEQVNVSVKRESSEGSPDFTVFSSSPELTLITSEEEEHTISLAQAIQLEPDYSFSTIYRYLRSREEI
ncbi:hypothetical protein GCM10008929_13560 [Alkalibacterium psychrotolerans]